jgi:hypothetical protein
MVRVSSNSWQVLPVRLTFFALRAGESRFALVHIPSLKFGIRSWLSGVTLLLVHASYLFRDRVVLLEVDDVNSQGKAFRSILLDSYR